MQTKRLEKLRKLFMQEISNLIIYDLDDSNLKNVVITRVEVTPDLKNAKVYFTTLKEGEEKNAQKALESAKGLIRSLLLKKLKLKYVPDIAFIFDKDLKYLEKVWEHFQK